MSGQPTPATTSKRAQRLFNCSIVLTILLIVIGVKRGLKSLGDQYSREIDKYNGEKVGAPAFDISLNPFRGLDGVIGDFFGAIGGFFSGILDAIFSRDGLVCLLIVAVVVLGALLIKAHKTTPTP